jgi:hypothetical protein
MKNKETLMDKFRKIDTYGAPIALNYEGKNRFKTNLGAVMTILTRMFILYSSLFKIIRLITLRNPHFTPYSTL